MEEKYLKELNVMQHEAVLYTEGPLLIVAGAGAGKTKTITHRIAHLVEKGVNPSNILAVTFTNKAAREMRERTLKILSGKNYDAVPFISTFHALGVSIIKENAHLVGLTKYFTIIDESDAISMIKEFLKEMSLDPKEYEPRKIKSIISRAKGDFIDIESFTRDAMSGFQSITARIWEKYEKQLKKEQSLDFDDLLLKAVKVLREHIDIREKYHKRWQYIHIDEYQDTNEVQYVMTKLLVGKDENVCVVGDTDQNIYSWRGANIKNMLHFEKDYPDTKIVLLEQNYRSTKTILEAANEIIKKNVFRAPKNLFTENVLGDTITIFEAYDEGNEARYIARKTYELLEKNLAEAKQIAVLYRANFQSRVLEEAFIDKQIPYQVLGTKFFDRKEIKDVLSYMRASMNPESLSEIKRIINFPARGIGKTTLLKIFAGEKHTLPFKMQEKIKNFYDLLKRIDEYRKTHSVSESLIFTIKERGIENELSKGTNEEQERLENIKELVSVAIKYDQFGEEGIELLLTDASLASDQDSLNKDNGGVRLMTVHASKGLEFKYVFIAGLEQDLFPHQRLNAKGGDQEEERRLFYVALTRAEHKLFLSYASIRTIFGMKQMTVPSEFLEDIPEHLLELEKDSGENGGKIVYI